MNFVEYKVLYGLSKYHTFLELKEYFKKHFEIEYSDHGGIAFIYDKILTFKMFNDASIIILNAKTRTILNRFNWKD